MPSPVRLTSQTKVKKVSSKPVRRKKTLSSIQIALNNQQRRVTIRERSLCRIAREVLALEKVSHAEIGIRIVTDRTMATLNRRWLGHDGATDVVTFPLSDESRHIGNVRVKSTSRAAIGRSFFPQEEKPDALLGDIVVSADTADREALRLGCTTHEELAYYVVHGLLHLTGHDDHSLRDSRRMRRREAEVMVAVGLRSPLRDAIARRTRQGKKK